MKKIYFTLAITLCQVSCNGNKSTGNDINMTEDSAATVSMESAVAGPTVFYLTKDSIGPIKIGEEISNLPVAVANLYDNMIVTETPDAMAYTFLLADVPQFTIYDFMEGKVDVISLEGNARAVDTPQGQLRIGDEFSKVLQLDGVKSEWQSLDDTGIWYWYWNGLYFGVDEMEINEKFSDALCNGRHAPRSSEFTPDIKIGYIATGLPF